MMQTRYGDVAVTLVDFVATVEILGEVLTVQSNVRTVAVELAREIAANAPLAVQSVRATVREGLVAGVKAATAHEYHEQHWLRQTQDHHEGLRAVAERRPARFVGR